MTYALDTNVASEPRKPRPHGALLAWFEAHPRTAYAIPAIVFYELQRGAELTRLQNRERAEELDSWIDSLPGRVAILPFDAAVARETSRLLQKQSPDLFVDAAIAATARVHGLIVATRNTKDFKRFDVPLVNPFLFGRQ